MDRSESRSGSPFRTVGVFGVFAVWLSACGNPVGSPDDFFPPGITDFNGRYAISHSFSVPGTARGAGCTGDADISSDLDFAFSGTIDIDASGPCSALPGRVGQLVGSVRGETITFSVEGLQDPLSVIGCSATGGVRNFEGSFTTRQFGDVMRVQTLRGTLDARAICDGESGETTARWEIHASRR
ncbi:MAG: hypothetical protein ACREMK_13825 [Gemmatimonadota bacterium]